MHKIRLLERIRRAESNPDYRGTADHGAIVLSIHNHLERILNTRQGSALIAEDYGMPDFTNLIGNFSSESTRDLSRDIQQVIARYEPRLSNVRVAVVESDELSTSLHFQVSCHLASDDGRSRPVAFQTIIDSEGKVQVK
jgi:type VI secretion system protein